MGGVEHAQLDLLVGRHVVGELDADLLQRRPAGAEPVLDHPLDEVLGEDRQPVVDAGQRVQPGHVLRRHRRRDAVDHAGGEGGVGGDPVGERRIAGGGERQHALRGSTAPLCWRLSQDSTVKAGRPSARRCASAATMKPNTVRGASGWARSWTMSGASSRNCAGRLVEVVAALGDRQRDDADRGIAQPRQHRGGVGRREQVLDDGADDAAGRLALRREQAQRVEPVLLRPCPRPWRARPGCRSGRRRRCPSLPARAGPGSGRHRPPGAPGGSCRR